MKYVALLTGEGKGCDYTIGCNKTFEIFEAPDDTEAMNRCKQMWEDRGGARGSPHIETIELFAVAKTMDVPVKQWNELDTKEYERQKTEKDLQKAEALVKELRSKLDNE